MSGTALPLPAAAPPRRARADAAATRGSVSATVAISERECAD